MRKLLNRLQCFFGDHIFKENQPITLDGKFAVLAGLWFPAATCSRCGAKHEPINERYAIENGWRVQP